MASQTDNPNKRFTATAAATFQRTMLRAVETAAPVIPNRGIAQAFNTKLQSAANHRMRCAERSCPVMLSKYMTGPHNAFTT